MLQIPKYKLENKYRYVVINHLCCVNRRRCQVGRTYVAIWTGKTQARCLPLDFLLLLNIVIIVFVIDIGTRKNQARCLPLRGERY